MKVTAKVRKTINITHIECSVPVRYGDEQMPLDHPHRNGDTFCVRINIDTGRIEDWPEGVESDIHIKVVDEGDYRLYDESGAVVSDRNWYVPDFMPGDHYGDYLILGINSDGTVRDWQPHANEIAEWLEADD